MILPGVLVLTGLVFSAWRLLDHRAERKAMRELVSAQPAEPPVFTAEMVADLPEPARRYFLYTIEPGTPLSTIALISMAGRFGMGDKRNPIIWTSRQPRCWPCLSGSSGKCAHGEA